MVKLVLYDPESKNKFIEKLSDDRIAKAFFNKTSPYEFLKRKDIYEFSEKETIDLFLETDLVTYRQYSNCRAVLNLWREEHNKPNLKLLNEQEIKRKYIERGSIKYVLDIKDLYSSILQAVNDYNFKESFDYTSYFMMPMLYELLVYMNLTEEQISSLTRISSDNYSLPDNIKVEEFVMNLIGEVSQMDSYLIKGNVKNIRKYFAESNLLIRMKPDTMIRTMNKLGVSKLNHTNIAKAIKFNMAFENDIRKHDFKTILSMIEIEHNMEHGVVKKHGFTRTDEELYNIWKGIRLKHSL